MAWVPKGAASALRRRVLRDMARTVVDASARMRFSARERQREPGSLGLNTVGSVYILGSVYVPAPDRPPMCNTMELHAPLTARTNYSRLSRLILRGSSAT
jgi:hypothetical protein